MDESDRSAARPFGEQPRPGRALQPPVILIVAVAVAVVAGVSVGALTGASTGERIARAVFHAAAFAYFVTSIADLLELRDGLVLAAPAIFLALGWRDELVYHRRRSTHREDVLHTVSHLAAGVMLAGAVASKMIEW